MVGVVGVVGVGIVGVGGLNLVRGQSSRITFTRHPPPPLIHSSHSLLSFTPLIHSSHSLLSFASRTHASSFACLLSRSHIHLLAGRVETAEAAARLAEKVRVEALAHAKKAEADRKAAEERWGAVQAARAEERRAKLAAAEEARLAELDKLHALWMVTLHNDETHTDRQAAAKLVRSSTSTSWLIKTNTTYRRWNSLPAYP